MILDLPACFIVFVALGVSRFVRVCGPVHRPYPGWQRQQLPPMPSGKFRSGQTGAAEVPSERKQETQEIESQHCKKNTKKRQNLPYRFKLMKETPCTKYNISIYINKYCNIFDAQCDTFAQITQSFWPPRSSRTIVSASWCISDVRNVSKIVYKTV